MFVQSSISLRPYVQRCDPLDIGTYGKEGRLGKDNFESSGEQDLNICCGAQPRALDSRPDET